MKFGKQLELSSNIEWREHYVQYKRLKRMIKRVVFEEVRLDKKTKTSESVAMETSPLLVEGQINTLELENAKQEFWQLIEENMQTVNSFYRGKILSLRKCIKQFEVVWRSDVEGHGHVHTRPNAISQDVDRGFAKLQEMYDELVDLKAFVQLNHSAFRKIVKKVRTYVRTDGRTCGYSRF